jgi:hypothetical protein
MKVLWPYRDVGLEIVGVVDEGVPASLLGMIAGRPISFGADTIADGTRVRRIGERFLEVSHLVDHILKVPHDEIVSAMRRYHQATGIKLEGAGALALAGEALGKRYDLFGSQESTLNLALVSGKNVDPATFDEAVNATKRLDTSVFMRKAFDVVIPERDGELLHLLQAVKDFNIAGLLYKQRSGASEGHLRIEFEVERARLDELAEIVEREFPGSHEINEGQQMLFEVGDALTAEFNDELIELSDRPGSFLRHVEMLSADGSFGSVGFLFYQKPMRPGLLPQVVIGRAADTAPAGNQEYAGVAFPVGW